MAHNPTQVECFSGGDLAAARPPATLPPELPSWLQSVAQYNPITYASDTLRTLVLHSNAGIDTARLITNFQFLIAFVTVFAVAGLILAERGLKTI